MILYQLVTTSTFSCSNISQNSGGTEDALSNKLFITMDAIVEAIHFLLKLHIAKVLQWLLRLHPASLIFSFK
jgi:hypothetical protein